jgi:hypothetical protein
MRTLIGGLRLGDTVRVSVERESGTFEAAVAVTGYERPTVRLEEEPNATDAQRRLRGQWLAGE